MGQARSASGQLQLRLTVVLSAGLLAAAACAFFRVTDSGSSKPVTHLNQAVTTFQELSQAPVGDDWSAFSPPGSGIDEETAVRDGESITSNMQEARQHPSQSPSYHDLNHLIASSKLGRLLPTVSVTVNSRANQPSKASTKKSAFKVMDAGAPDEMVRQQEEKDQAVRRRQQLGDGRENELIKELASDVRALTTAAKAMQSRGMASASGQMASRDIKGEGTGTLASAAAQHIRGQRQSYWGPGAPSWWSQFPIEVGVGGGGGGGGGGGTPEATRGVKDEKMLARRRLETRNRQRSNMLTLQAEIKNTASRQSSKTRADALASMPFRAGRYTHEHWWDTDGKRKVWDVSQFASAADAAVVRSCYRSRVKLLCACASCSLSLPLSLCLSVSVCLSVSLSLSLSAAGAAVVGYSKCSD